ncbi:hypothetical protein [Pseudomonas akapageensis]|uniref:hypothetical protein n=1 Tax=Pseudomonas akapageensis TaxID=2609961 RepID=UPI00140C3E65|nr:hypothetical protein [Pseudomonas akapageensis]
MKGVDGLLKIEERNAQVNNKGKEFKFTVKNINDFKVTIKHQNPPRFDLGDEVLDMDEDEVEESVVA